MPREKRFPSQETRPTETAATADEQKGKAANAKVTLVKPILDEPEDEAPVSGDKQKPRPKVGRSNARRKKTAVDTLAADQGSEHGALADTAALSAEEETLKHDIASDASPEELQEKLAQVELAPDWGMPGHARHWDVKFTLFLLALFAAVNIGLVFMLNNNHKAKVLVETAATHLSKEPAAPPPPPVKAPPSAPVPEPAMQKPPAKTATLPFVPPMLPDKPVPAAPADKAPGLASSPKPLSAAPGDKIQGTAALPSKTPAPAPEKAPAAPALPAIAPLPEPLPALQAKPSSPPSVPETVASQAKTPEPLSRLRPAAGRPAAIVPAPVHRMAGQRQLLSIIDKE